MRGSHPPLGMAVVGVGAFGRHHAHIWRDLPSTRLVAIADHDADRARRAATEFGAERWYTDHDELLRDPEVEAVSICTAESQHRIPSVAAAEAGKHILLEKPIATSVEDADAIAVAARKAGVVLQVGHVLRFDARYAAIKERLELGDLGPIIQMVARRQSKATEAHVYYNRVTPLLLNGIHDADLMLWFAGEPVVEVYASSAASFGGRYPDVTWAHLRFRSGALGVLEAGWLMPGGHPTYQLRMEVFCRDGGAFLDQTTPLLSFSDAHGTVSPETHYQTVVRGELWGALRHQAEHFVARVRDRLAPFVGATEATAALRLMLSTQLSSDTGRAVAVDA